jgi:Amt family ammonium transporter
MCGVVRHLLKIDDSLDVFAVHGVGGILGTLLAAFLGHQSLGGVGGDFNMGSQFVIQLQSLAITIAWSIVATVIIVLIVKAVTGLRVSEETEQNGLDQEEHGETAYTLENRKGLLG